ncbi:MAG: pyruvate carboxyltransferase [Ignavibacteria bacterium]
MNYPRKVVLGDITVRDGFQHEEKYIPLEAKLWLAEQLILAGFKNVEITNLGNPRAMPQFKDGYELIKRIKTSKKTVHLIDSVTLTAVTIREKAIIRAIEDKKNGFGPDRILLMTPTSYSYHFKNAGMSYEDYWKLAEKYIKLCDEVGIKVDGSVSTIWGCPIEGPTDLNRALEFTKRWLDIGASDVEHADHDGSATPDRIYDYFSMVLDKFQNPEKHIAHLHSTHGWGLANVLAALQAGMTNYESTMGGLGGQPANFFDGVPVMGTGDYYSVDTELAGLICTEDMVVMMDEMGIETGLDIEKVLNIGRMVERIVGRKLRSESIRTGRVPKELKSN